jgi:hypothetical protein
VVESQNSHYENLISTSNIDFIGPLVLIVGIIVIVFGLLMVLLAWRIEPQTAGTPRRIPTAAKGLPAR